MVRAIAFVVGAASLGTEIAAARLLAPYFGASTIIWANTIATVLVALSAGYWLGGKLADRRADLRGLCAVVLVASLLLALVPFVADPFLRLSVDALGSLSVGGFAGSLAAVLVLVAVPVMLLGTVAPYVSRLSVQSVSETGRTIGNLYAISTVGSLVGTFLAALLLIPTIGTHRTFIVFALSLALVVGAGAAACGASGLVPLLVGGVAGHPAGGDRSRRGRTAGSSTRPRPSTSTRASSSSPAASAGCSSTRGWPCTRSTGPGRFLTRGYWDDFLVLPFAARSAGAAPPGGSPSSATPPARWRAPTATSSRDTRVDAVELDGKLTDDRQALLPPVAGRACTSTPPTPGRGCRPATPATTRSSWTPTASPTSRSTSSRASSSRSARAHLHPGGTFIVNVGHLPDSSALERVVTATLRAVFPYVVRDRVSADNSLLVASTAPLSAASMIAAHAQLPLGAAGPAGLDLGPARPDADAAARSTPTTRRPSSG